MSRDVLEHDEINHDDHDLVAVQGHRADLTGVDDTQVAAARERLAALDGADRPLGSATGSGRGRTGRPLRLIAGLAAAGVAASLVAVALWAASDGGPSGPATVPAAPASTSTSTTTRSTSKATPVVPAPEGLFAEGQPLHCMALNDEPLGEVARKLATTDLKVVYTLPETDSASGKRERWTQARAAADTTMKVSEVMERDSSTIEVYFWSKDNPDFQPQLLKDDFDRRCPTPR